MTFDPASLMGAALPDRALPSSRGGRVNPARAPGRVLVFIYPYTGRPGVPDPEGWDKIPNAHGSTPQAQAYSAAYSEYLDLGVKVFGLSLQTPDWQAEAAQRLALQVPLLSDADGQWSEALALPRFTIGTTHYLRRLTLLAEAGRIIALRFPVDPPAGDAAHWLQSLRLMLPRGQG